MLGAQNDEFPMRFERREPLLEILEQKQAKILD